MMDSSLPRACSDRPLAFDDAKIPVGLSIQRSSDGVIGERELFANQTTAVVAARFTMKVFCHSGLKRRRKLRMR